MIKRDQTTENRLLPDRKPYAMTILQCKCCFLIWKPELLSFRPKLDDIRRCHSGFDCINGDVKNVAAALICIHHSLGGTAYREGSIVASSIPVVAVQDVEI